MIEKEFETEVQELKRKVSNLLNQQNEYYNDLSEKYDKYLTELDGVFDLQNSTTEDLLWDYVFNTMNETTFEEYLNRFVR